MKNIKKISCLFLIGLILFTGCTDGNSTISMPDATSDSTTNVTQEGDVTANGGATTTSMESGASSMKENTTTNHSSGVSSTKKTDAHGTETSVAKTTSTSVMKPTDDGKLRVWIGSDVHCTNLLEWYGWDYRDRMQHWVDSLLAEHARDPFDLVVINGDISLDFWASGGSVINHGEGTSKIFINEYLSQLPEDLPVFVMPGNHEQYTDEQWVALTGNHRQGSMVIGDVLFLFMDNFASELNPNYHHDGIYTKTDVDYVEKMMNKHPDKDVYIITHYIDPDKESIAFKKLVADSDRIKGMFAGHTHQSKVIQLGVGWGNKTIAQTGNFAYFKDSASESFWGFRELVISKEAAYSQYIIVESIATVDGRERHFKRTARNIVGYYGETPTLETNEVDPLKGYTKLYSKIDKSSVKGDAGVSSAESVEKIFDENEGTKWCVRSQSSNGSIAVEWAMTESVQLDAYAFTTANDRPERNPDAWTLYGKNDLNGQWTTISAVTAGNLPYDSHTTSTPYTIEKPTKYRYYKLVITENLSDKSTYQFSELILLKK